MKDFKKNPLPEDLENQEEENLSVEQGSDELETENSVFYSAGSSYTIGPKMFAGRPA